MTIVSQQIIEDSPQPSGKRYVQYEYTDHLGRKHRRGRILVDSAFDANADMISRIPSIEADLIDRETELFEGDPLVAVFKYTNKKKVIRAMLVRAMKDENPKLLLALDPIITWVRANYTGAQIANYLDITIQQAQNIANRFDALVAVASTLNADVPEDID